MKIIEKIYSKKSRDFPALIIIYAKQNQILASF
jgi:hypothetical protein